MKFFQKRLFPTARIPKRFVGQAFDADDNLLHPDHGDML
jgi:hypothetical protein